MKEKETLCCPYDKLTLGVDCMGDAALCVDWKTSFTKHNRFIVKCNVDISRFGLPLASRKLWHHSDETSHHLMVSTVVSPEQSSFCGTTARTTHDRAHNLTLLGTLQSEQPKRSPLASDGGFGFQKEYSQSVHHSLPF